MTTGLLNPTHLIILLIVALIILGPKRLPQAGRSLGRGMREFRDGISGRDNPSDELDEAPRSLAVATPALDAAPVAPEQAISQAVPATSVAAPEARQVPAHEAGPPHLGA